MNGKYGIRWVSDRWDANNMDITRRVEATVASMFILIDLTAQRPGIAREMPMHAMYDHYLV